MNVALRLISLCPLAFQPSRLAPRTQTVRKSPSPEGQARAIQSQSPHFVAPLFSWPYELLFPQTLYIQKHLRCPPGVPRQTLFPKDNYVDLPTTLAYPLHYQPIAHSCSLAALFRTPALCFQQLADSLCKNRGVGYLRIRTYAQLSLRPLCVVCGASAFPALSFPSFGGPKNADAR